MSGIVSVVNEFITQGLTRAINVESCDNVAGANRGVYKYSCEFTQTDTKNLNKTIISQKLLRAYIAFELHSNEVIEQNKYQNPPKTIYYTTGGEYHSDLLPKYWFDEVEALLKSQAPLMTLKPDNIIPSGFAKIDEIDKTPYIKQKAILSRQARQHD